MTTIPPPESVPPPSPGEVDLRVVERRSLVLLALLLAGSLLLDSRRVTLGVLVGGFLAFLNYFWLKSFFGEISRTGCAARPWRVALYSTKYVLTGGVIMAAVGWKVVNVFGLLAGLMVVILAITLEGFKGYLATRGGNR